MTKIHYILSHRSSLLLTRVGEMVGLSVGVGCITKTDDAGGVSNGRISQNRRLTTLLCTYRRLFTWFKWDRWWARRSTWRFRTDRWKRWWLRSLRWTHRRTCRRFSGDCRMSTETWSLGWFITWSFWHTRLIGWQITWCGGNTGCFGCAYCFEILVIFNSGCILSDLWRRRGWQKQFWVNGWVLTVCLSVHSSNRCKTYRVFPFTAPRFNSPLTE